MSCQVHVLLQRHHPRVANSWLFRSLAVPECQYRSTFTRNTVHTVHALRHARCSSKAEADTQSAEFWDTLQHLKQVPNDHLREWVLASSHRVTLQFLVWLAQQEAVATGSEKEQLWWLGSQVTVITEGLDPAAYEQVQMALQEAAEQLPALPSASGTSGAAGLATLDAKNVAALRAQSLMSLTPEGMAFLQQQMGELSGEMRLRQRTAAVDLMGRSEAQEDSYSNMRNADAAVRILDYLLTLRDSYERTEALCDAFTPPEEPTAAPGEDDGQDYLYTTPIRLLQVIDMYVMRVERGGSVVLGGEVMLSGPDEVLSGEDLQEALQELRAEVRSQL